jgi:rhamnogalacturonyl hydrolase YesR
MTDRSPLAVARVLASEYGFALAPVNYVRGVAISGRLRLHQLAPSEDDPAPSIAELVEPFIAAEQVAEFLDADGSVHAGYLWADELRAATGDARYGAALTRLADGYLEPRPDGRPTQVDADFRVEDIFFGATILGRAYALSEDDRYRAALSAFLTAVHAEPDSGLWHHSGASPFTWGRGNAFAALGFAEGLSYLPADDPARPALEAKHRVHLESLVRHQDGSGAWRQVIDRPDAYLELTATAMIGYALARGLRRGWLPTGLEGATARAWTAVAERVDGEGMVRDSCPGTGPLPTLQDYLERAPISGHDDRAGSMALWFAVEYATYLGAA